MTNFTAKVSIMTTLKQGDKAPEFTAQDQDGNQHSLQDYRGKKLLLFFYPKASTPGCTAQACNLRDNWKSFQAQGFEILGVSADNPQKQQKFKEKYELPFPLLADENKKVIEAYGVWGPKKFMGKSYEGINRTSFVIDEEGVITDVISKVKTKAHAAQIL